MSTERAQQLTIVSTYRLIAAFRDLEPVHWERNRPWPGLHVWEFPRLVILDLGCADRFYCATHIPNFEALKRDCKHHGLDYHPH